MNSAIKWMAGNHVAANLLMVFFLVGGAIVGLSVKQEVFPEIELDTITVTVPYPGAGPEEIEDGILLKLEETLSGLSQIKETRSVASEGAGIVTLEVMDGEDVDQALQDVKSEIDRITTLPEDAEKPIVSKLVRKREVISAIVYGQGSERSLREYAEDVRDELLAIDGITQVELAGVRPYEISVEVHEDVLRSYGLTLQGVASAIGRASLDLPAGSVKTSGGEVLIRARAKRLSGKEFEAITVIENANGTEVKLGDIAKVRDTFEETDSYARFDGQPAARIKVYRVGDQKPDDISAKVRDYVIRKRATLPQSMNMETWSDSSELFKGRKDLLIKNAFFGLILVLITLGLFLQIRLALWVMLGLPISFLGAMILLPSLDVSINMISLFAFILVLGIVVDDAIVVGESIYEHRTMGKSHYRAAVDGTLEVGGPVVFAILTTLAAFMPLLFIAGSMGKFMRVVPLIIMPVLVVSLIECIFVLPSHLAKGRAATSEQKRGKAIYRVRESFNRRFQWFVTGPYSRLLSFCLRHKPLTVAVAIAILFLSFGIVGGGIIKFTFMPDVESDMVQVSIELPVGTVVGRTAEVHDFVLSKGMETAAAISAEHGGQRLVRNIYSTVGASEGASGPELTSQTGTNLSSITMYLTPGSERDVPSGLISSRWRKAVGEMAGVESITYKSNLMSFGSNIDVQLSHKDMRVILEATEKLKATLAEYPGVINIRDSFADGKRELNLRLTPEARTLGLTEIDLARQVRGAFYGIEAMRLQRGRNEVKVMVRYPENDRRSIDSLKSMYVRTPSGGAVPLSVAADVSEGRGFNIIKRTDRKRVINVSADVDESLANSSDINAVLKSSVLPVLSAGFPGLVTAFEGEDKERTESMASLRTGFLLALFLIFILLAIPFKSYSQPLIIMAAIPFGIVGGILGHLVMGYNLSILSMFGIVALSGVVVNDSLLLIDFINRKRLEGVDMFDAVMQAGQRRFRPILLTSLTTFFGLAPMILETDMQARFLIPMAISLGFGILFATGITLIIIPVLYMTLERVKEMLGIKNESPEQYNEEPTV